MEEVSPRRRTACEYGLAVAARLGHLTLDTTDLDRAVTFWAAVLAGEVWKAPDGAIAIVQAAGSPDLMIQRVERTAPGKNPIHLDLFTDELGPEVQRLTDLGASEVARFDQWGAVWATLTDPDGYVFDVVEHQET